MFQMAILLDIGRPNQGTMELNATSLRQGQLGSRALLDAPTNILIPGASF